MALLDSGATAQVTGTSASASVAVTAGAGNRKLIVGFAGESPATVTALTFNGQDLVANGLLIANTDIFTDGVSGCQMFEQFEAGLPSSGSFTLSATFSTSTTGGVVMYYWLVDGVRQDQLADGGSGEISNSGSSTSTWQTDETFVAGEDDRALFAVGYRNDAATSLALTTPSGATNFGSTTLAGGGRVVGSHKVGSMGTGTIRPAWTTQAANQNRRTGAAAMLNPLSGASLSLTAAALSAGSATISVASSLGHPITAAALQASQAAVAVDASRGRDLAAALASGSASVSVAASRGRELVAALEASGASLSAPLELAHPLTVGLASSAADVAVSASRGRALATALAAGSAALSTAFSRGRSLGASLQASDASLAAPLGLTRPLSVALQAGSAAVGAVLSVAGSQDVSVALAAAGAAVSAAMTRVRGLATQVAASSAAVAVSAVRGRDLGVALQAGPAAVGVTAERERTLSASIQAGQASLSASLGLTRSLMAALAAGPAEVAARIDIAGTRDLAVALQAGVSALSAALARGRALTAVLSAGRSAVDVRAFRADAGGSHAGTGAQTLATPGGEIRVAPAAEGAQRVAITTGRQTAHHPLRKAGTDVALIGTGVASTQEFRDSTGYLADPTTVSLVVRAPDGTKTTYVFGVDPEIERISEGVYRFRHVPDAAGEWGYYWLGTGAVAYSEEAFVTITASAVLA